jgi:Tfp pilus assembly protein FimT
VTAVLVVLLVMTVPRFQRTAQRLRLEHSAFEIAQLFRYGHERAVTESREMIVAWDSAARRMRLSAGRQESGSPTDAGRVIHSAALLPQATVAVSVDGAPVSCGCVRFFADGTSEPAILTLSLEPNAYTITVNDTTGQVFVEKGIPAR